MAVISGSREGSNQFFIGHSQSCSPFASIYIPEFFGRKCLTIQTCQDFSVHVRLIYLIETVIFVICGEFQFKNAIICHYKFFFENYVIDYVNYDVIDLQKCHKLIL